MSEGLFGHSWEEGLRLHWSEPRRPRLKPHAKQKKNNSEFPSRLWLCFQGSFEDDFMLFLLRILESRVAILLRRLAVFQPTSCAALNLVQLRIFYSVKLEDILEVSPAFFFVQLEGIVLRTTHVYLATTKIASSSKSALTTNKQG